MKLTDAACRAAKKAESICYLPAGDGLRLMIHPNGGKYWCVRYYMDDKEKTARVGHYPDVGLKAAKLQRNAVQKGAAEGKAPLRDRVYSSHKAREQHRKHYRRKID